MNRRMFLGALALVGALMLTGCGGGGGGSTAKEPNTIFVHASPDGGSVDIALNDRREVTAAGYLAATAWRTFPFISEADGGYDISVAPTGTTNDLARIATGFGRDTNNVVIVDGLAAGDPADPQKSLDITLFSVNRTRPNGNKSRFIVFNAFQRAQGLSTPAVVFRNPGENPIFATGTINPGSQSAIEVDSGSWTWQVKRADGEAIYASTTRTTPPGSVFLVLISGVEGSTTTPPTITFIDLIAVD